MAHDRDDDLYPACFFFRQPKTFDEHVEALAAIGVSCCGALRYAGSNPGILNVLSEMGRATACDALVTPPQQRLADPSHPGHP